ncbi:MAG: DUF1559 domain-containing protein, partial [Victivallaceae bacterium]
KKITCKNNLKQIGLGSINYASDFNNYMHINFWNGVQEITWSENLYNNKYIGNKNVFLCPAQTPNEYTSGYFTYGIRISIPSDSKISVPVSTYYLHLPRVTAASQFHLYADTVFVITASNAGMQGYLFSDTSLNGNKGIHLRHPGEQANLWFVDGHAASQNMLDLKNRGISIAVNKAWQSVTF